MAIPAPTGFVDLPWEIIERIILPDALSFTDTLSAIRVYAPSYTTAREFVASINNSSTLWEKKFRSLYPDLYRILVKDPTAKFFKEFDWYSLLETRWIIGENIDSALRSCRHQNMEETFEKLQSERDNLVSRLLNSQPGDIRYPRSDRETIPTTVPCTEIDLNFLFDAEHIRGRSTVSTAFVGSDILTGNTAHGKLDNCITTLTEIMGYLDKMMEDMRVDGHCALVPTMEEFYSDVKWMHVVVDSVRDYVDKSDANNDYIIGWVHNARNVLKMSQLAASFREVQIALFSQPPTPEDTISIHAEFSFFINFLQACYHSCDNLVTVFYGFVWKAADYFRRSNAQLDIHKITGINSVRATVSWIRCALQQPGVSGFIMDDLAFASGFVCNFPFSQHTVLPILTFFYLAKMVLSKKNVTVTLQRLSLKMLIRKDEVDCHWSHDFYITVPCIHVDEVDYFCLPYKIRKGHGANNEESAEIFTDLTRLAAALHRTVFSCIVDDFGSVREIQIVSNSETGLMEHLRLYVNVESSYGLTESRLYQSILQRSKAYGSISLLHLCTSLIGTSVNVWIHNSETYCTRKLTEHNNVPYRYPSQAGTCQMLPVGTVVRIKYRKLTPDFADQDVDHLAVVVSWEISEAKSISTITADRITYNLLCLDPSHPNDPYIPPRCARLAEHMSVAERIPEEIQMHIKNDSMLWILFDSFDGMFFIPQPSLAQQYPANYNSSMQEDVRKSLRKLRDNSL